MKLRDIMVGLVLFAVLIAGSATFYTNLFSNYGKAQPANLSTMETVDTMEQKATSLQDKTQKITQMNLESIFSFVAAIPDALSILAQIPVLAIQTVTEVIEPLGMFIPSWVSTVIPVVITIVVVMMIISAIQKWKM